MLPSFRLIVATFLGAFVLAAVGLHLAASPRATPDNLAAPPALTAGRGGIQPAIIGAITGTTIGAIDWRNHTPLPVMFDLRFSSDLTAIATTPARLTVPAAEPKVEPPALPELAPLANPADAEVAAPPEPPAAVITPPDHAMASAAMEQPDVDLAPIPPPAVMVLLPMPRAVPASRDSPPVATAVTKKAALRAKPLAKPRPARRAATARTNTAAQTPFFDLFGDTQR